MEFRRIVNTVLCDYKNKSRRDNVINYTTAYPIPLYDHFFLKPDAYL